MKRTTGARARIINLFSSSKSSLFRVLLCALFAAVLFTALTSCGVFEKRVEGVDNGGFIDYSKTYSATPISGDLTNLVIFVCFSDEDVDEVRLAIGDSLIGYFNGDDNSLKDYYQKESYNRIRVDSLFAVDSTEYFIYRANKTRNEYKSVKKNTSASTRYREESVLLNAAVNAADEYFDYTGKNLDVNGDGFVDSVAFIVSGGYDSSDQNAWGGLLWPHSWELDVITSKAGGTTAKLNGIKVNRYSFNFMTSVNVGLLCHETGHVLGMPDLYHYDYDTNYVQVGAWDLMHLNSDTPQYSLTYLRQKYLNVVGDDQIVDLTGDGVYTLKPTTAATAEDVLAYRLILNENETLYMEYRNKNVSTYDSMLPGSGLIVYRVNGNAEGNTGGRNRNVYFPDEVYVYRPNVESPGNKTREINNLSRAFLSPNNADFSSLGNATSTSKYLNGAIYLTNGVNTGVVISAEAIDDEKVTFSVRLNGYGRSEVSDIYVEGKPEINYGENLDITVKIKMKGYNSYVTADPTKYSISYDPTLVGTQTAIVRYRDGEDEISCSFILKINDKVETNGVAKATSPEKLVYQVGERMDLSGLSITVRYVSGSVINVAYSDDTDGLWEVNGVDFNSSGEYNAKVTYKPFGVYVYIGVTVTSELESIAVSEKNTLTVFDLNEDYHIMVEGVSRDGRRRTLASDEFGVSAISRNVADLYVEQTVTVTAVGSLNATKKVFAVKYSDLVKVEPVTLPKTVYRYGEALDLTNGMIKLTFTGHEMTVPLSNYYNRLDETYNPTKRGVQNVSVTFGGVTFAFDVTVLLPDESILSATDEGVAVDINKGCATFRNPTDLAKAEKSFASYLTVRFIYTDGAIVYEINSSTYDYMMNRNVGIELINANGQKIKTFRVFVFGDGNNDGKVNSADASSWSDALFRQTPGSANYLDANGDGVYGLTDFAILTARYGGGNA